MAKYDVEIRYIPGKTNVVADALSRVSHMESPSREDALPEIRVDTVTCTLPATPAKLQFIREETNKDEILYHLKDIIYQGWPVSFQECPSDLRDYWNFREDLSVENGLVLKGHRLIIPHTLRKSMLSLVHQGHLGTEKCLPRAKDCLFWPGISKDIKELTSNCSTCSIHVAPNAVITFVSKLYPGSVSDKAILLANVFEHGDLILADKGFLVHDIMPNGVSVIIPPYLNNGKFYERVN